ncbi:histidine phosphatase family protein [Candidatus Micrarchaeota archaeon]|nr:histidine phosphatase family protein [Candidatus Micrarchaeota archaeon]
MEIYLVRHGEVDDNFNAAVPHPESHLNHNGIEQAKVAGNALKEIHFDKIFSSPYPRAKETAEEINKFINHEHIEFDHRLTDIHLPSWYGTSIKEYKEARAKCSDGWYNYRRNNDESFVMAYQRVRGFYDDIIRLNQKEDINILIIAHSDMIKSLLLLILDLDVDMAKKIKIKNCGIVHLKYYDIPYYKGFMLVHDLFVANKSNINPDMTNDINDTNENISSGMNMF